MATVSITGATLRLLDLIGDDGAIRGLHGISCTFVGPAVVRVDSSTTFIDDCTWRPERPNLYQEIDVDPDLAWDAPTPLDPPTPAGVIEISDSSFRGCTFINIGQVRMLMPYDEHVVPVTAGARPDQSTHRSEEDDRHPRGVR